MNCTPMVRRSSNEIPEPWRAIHGRKGLSMEYLTDAAQGYCEIYCKKFGHCFGDPGDCVFQGEVAMYEKLKDFESTGLTPLEIKEKLGLLQQIEKKKAQEAKVAEMVDLAAHAIGLDNKKAYYRHGKYWYKPYRNHYCSGSGGDPVWEEMVEQGYATASRGMSSTFYHMTRAGLDWLGQQTKIKIHDPED